MPDEVAWQPNFDAAVKEASRSDRDLLLDFSAAPM